MIMEPCTPQECSIAVVNSESKALYSVCKTSRMRLYGLVCLNFSLLHGSFFNFFVLLVLFSFLLKRGYASFGLLCLFFHNTACFYADSTTKCYSCK